MAKTDLFLTDIVKKNPEKFLQLRQAFGILYDDDGNVAPENKSEAKSLLEQIHKFGIPDLTIKETGLFMEKLYEDLQKGTETITEVQEYKAESNMLTPDELAQFQKEQEEQSRKIKETIAESKEAVEKAIKTKKELYAKTKIQKPDLTSKQQEAAEVIVDEIKKAPTPEEAIKIVQPIIRESIPEEIPDAVVGLTAASIVINVKTNFTPTIQTELAKATSEKPEYSDLAAVLSDQSKTLSELKDLSSLTKDVTKLAFGDEGQKVLLPDIIIEDISDVPASGYMPIQASSIYVATTSTEEVDVVTFGRTWVQEQLSQIGEGNIQGTNYNPTKLQSSFSVFKPLTGIAKDAAIKGVKKLATKALSKTATGVAVKTGLKAAIASLGLPGGPVGVALTWLATEVFAKLGSKIKQFITKHKQDIAIAGLMLFGGGALMGSIPLMVLGGFIAIPSFIGGATLAGIGGSIFGLFGAIGGATLGAIGGPILFILLGFPVIVAFILFIINSGAYVVPQSSFESGQRGFTPQDCLGDPPPKPIATNVKFSSDGKYAFPVAPFEVPGYSCYHWDGNKATDIFSPQERPPLVAYEKGKIVNVTLNDSVGGKYIILQGTTSGRYYYHAHLCHVFVKAGDVVDVGEVIGTMDESGNGRVQHLHYAINEPPFSDTFIGGHGNVCPQEDFENKFGFGVCNRSNYCVSP